MMAGRGPPWRIRIAHHGRSSTCRKANTSTGDEMAQEAAYIGSKEVELRVAVILSNLANLSSPELLRNDCVLPRVV